MHAVYTKDVFVVVVGNLNEMNSPLAYSTMY